MEAGKFVAYLVEGELGGGSDVRNRSLADELLARIGIHVLVYERRLAVFRIEPGRAEVEGRLFVPDLSLGLCESAIRSVVEPPDEARSLLEEVQGVHTADYTCRLAATHAGGGIVGSPLRQTSHSLGGAGGERNANQNFVSNFAATGTERAPNRT